MKERNRENNIGSEERDENQKWVYDSSLNYKGKVPLRASTGVWKASLFIISKFYILFKALLVLIFVKSFS